MHKDKLIIGICGWAIVLSGLAVENTAAISRVQFEGGAENFVFYPDEGWTETDLFGEMKGMMPGDIRKEEIILKNTADEYDEVKIYLRAEPVEEDKNDDSAVSMREFLEQFLLRVYFDGELVSEGLASETAGLTENRSSGIFSYGTEKQVIVELSAPETLGSKYMHQVGEIVWVFTAEGFGDGSVNRPDTGRVTKVKDYATEQEPSRMLVMAICAVTVLIAIVRTVVRTHRRNHSY